MNIRVKMFTKDPCPYCVHAKEFFRSRGIGFEEISLNGKEDDYQKLKAQTGHMTVPQIFINDQFIGGYSDLKQAYESGKLKDLIP